jgi:hypothetical protein
VVLRASVDLGCPAFPVHVAADSIWDVAVAGMRVHVRTPAYALRDSPSTYALEQIVSHSGREVVSHRLPLSDSHDYDIGFSPTTAFCALPTTRCWELERRNRHGAAPIYYQDKIPTCWGSVWAVEIRQAVVAGVASGIE